MPKVATEWSSNTLKDVPVVSYSSPVISYSNPLVRYSAVDVTLDTYGKRASAWTKTAKGSANWAFNAAFDDNQRPYDGLNLYDGVLTYDGVTLNQSSISTKKTTQWNNT